MNDDEKWQYIRQISNISGINSHHLLDMMNKYNCNNLQEITTEQAKDYYEKLINKSNRNYRRWYI